MTYVTSTTGEPLSAQLMGGSPVEPRLPFASEMTFWQGLLPSVLAMKTAYRPNNPFIILNLDVEEDR